jgi:hypothetical protein
MPVFPMRPSTESLPKHPVHVALLSIAILLQSACSGIDVVPEPTATFEATNYTRYAWRSAPPTGTAGSKDMLVEKSPTIRSAAEEQMASLGYRRVEKDEAQFLIEYVAMRGLNEGQLSHGGSNDMLYGSSVNRDIDGASQDNAYALSGPVETGEVQLVFLDAEDLEVLWRVHISIVVEDTNRIDHQAVRRAVRKGLSALPPAR